MPFEQQQKQVRTVSEISREIQQLLDHRFRFVRIIGEISGLRSPLSGHCYFNLKDADSQIRAVLFKGQRHFLERPLRDGQQVICDGRITVYQPRGDYQLVVDTVDFHGEGQLQIAFEQLKRKLRDEGLFDSARKKPLPAFVEKIVIITSPTGAAVHDFLTICRRRRASLQIQILPVRVQGDSSATEIARALARAETLAPDVIVLCRGGGSLEDLWSFNEETVARAIAASAVPVVTGIGHETDYTIADFCADLRGATPTAAAELLVSDAAAYARRVDQALRRINRSLTWRLESTESRLAGPRRVLATFDSAFFQKTLKLDAALSRLGDAMRARIEQKKDRWAELNHRLGAQSPLHTLQLHRHRLDNLGARLAQSARHHLATKEASFRRSVAVLESVSPLATLARGYSITSRIDEDGGRQIVTDAAQVGEEDRISVQLYRGFLNCTVISSRRA